MSRRRKVHRGRWEIDRERFQHPRDVLPPAPERITPIGDVVGEVLHTLRRQERFWERALMEDWPRLVGPQVSQNTRPGHYQNGTLTIFVRTAGWLMEIRSFEPLILRTLRREFGASKIRRLRFQADPGTPRNR